jgi:hypothetical protein
MRDESKRRAELNQAERKPREDISKEELERLERYGSLSFKSIRRPDMRIEPYQPSREQH